MNEGQLPVELPLSMSFKGRILHHPFKNISLNTLYPGFWNVKPGN